MTTIKDIAKLADVSSATVSRVMNASGYVSEETRNKVEQAVKALKYTPNRNAQYLRKGATKNLGIISTQFNDTAIARINPFIELAHESGYTSTLFITNQDRKRELEAFDMLKSKQLDGILLIYRANEWDILEEYAHYGPVVTLHNIESETIHSVFIDHYNGYMKTLNYLWDKGYRNILNVYSTSYGLNTKRRIQAYEDFCQKHQLSPHPAKPFIGILRTEDAEKVVNWFHETTDKPDAIVAHSDTIAAVMVSKLKTLGYEIPKDVAVVGFDNLEISSLMNITTIDYAIDEQGKNACRLLLNQLNDETAPLYPLSFKLIERQTT
ncbi:LacI family DNA-binding transcriptional regulator [Marinilactibacillus kalidii]|uniref:LacI family DNA-binding transcriptional regulator n=1 Tax=Marinilactibacillus kalidii TaxID=2820274 RepID=UPI001ABE8C7E|nr:LacI family DNA-binding transcriptional regulator [Marinilactibacillus kalidii]